MSEVLQGKVYCEVKNSIATVNFYHPKSNSLPSQLLSELTSTIEACSLDENVSVILLKSEGEKAFCAGASFDELLAIENLEQSESFLK